MFVVNGKSERLYEMKLDAGCRAEARDITGIARDFRFYQNDMQSIHSFVFVKSMSNSNFPGRITARMRVDACFMSNFISGLHPCLRKS